MSFYHAKRCSIIINRCTQKFQNSHFVKSYWKRGYVPYNDLLNSVFICYSFCSVKTPKNPALMTSQIVREFSPILNCSNFNKLIFFTCSFYSFKPFLLELLLWPGCVLDLGKSGVDGVGWVEIMIKIILDNNNEQCIHFTSWNNLCIHRSGLQLLVRYFRTSQPPVMRNI